MRGSVAHSPGKIQSFSSNWVESVLKRITEQGMRIGTPSPKSTASPRRAARRVWFGGDSSKPQKEHGVTDESVTDTGQTGREKDSDASVIV